MTINQAVMHGKTIEGSVPMEIVKVLLGATDLLRGWGLAQGSSSSMHGQQR
jgi:hypothetical protein